MKVEANTVKAYLDQLPADRKKAVSTLRRVIKNNLPTGFREEINYNMIGYVVPHKLYPAGYHCDTSKPLPFMNIASQKNFVAVYHMGIYADKKLYQWFEKEYAALELGKLDMGKSCIRFKKVEKIPYDLIGKLAGKITPAQWIKRYESSRS